MRAEGNSHLTVDSFWRMISIFESEGIRPPTSAGESLRLLGLRALVSDTVHLYIPRAGGRRLVIVLAVIVF